MTSEERVKKKVGRGMTGRQKKNIKTPGVTVGHAVYGHGASRNVSV